MHQAKKPISCWTEVWVQFASWKETSKIQTFFDVVKCGH